MSASAAVWPDPFGRLRITSPATPCHLSFLLPIADHRLNSLHLPSPAPPPFAPFTHSIPIGPHSGLLEHAVSAMLRSTLRPPRGLCRRSTADTALMCSQHLCSRLVCVHLPGRCLLLTIPRRGGSCFSSNGLQVPEHSRGIRFASEQGDHGQSVFSWLYVTLCSGLLTSL